MRNKSVQIIIVTWKFWNLSLQIQGKFANINSTFFCSTIFSFAFVSILEVKGIVNYANKNVRLKNRCSFMEKKRFLMFQKRSIFRNIRCKFFILST